MIGSFFKNKISAPAMIGALILANGAFAQSEDAVRLYERGVAQNQALILVDASVLLTEAIALYPEYTHAYYQRGLSFEGMGQRASAMKDFNAAVGLRINIIDPYLRLISYHKQRQQYLAALVIADQLAVNMPENAAGAYYDKGQIFELMGKPREAIAAYQASINNLDSENAGFADVLTARISALRN